MTMGIKNSIHLTIKTPTSVIYNGEVISITIPTTDGYINVLPNHENLISTVDIGIIKIETIDAKVIELLSYEGIVVIKNGEVNVLTQEADSPTQEKLEELENAIQSASEKLETGTQLPSDLIRAEKELRYYLLKNKHN